MATTRLSDVVVPAVFDAYRTKDTMEKARIFQSGIMANDADLAGKLAGGGLTYQFPFWKDLADTLAGIANDDPTSLSTPGKIATGQMAAIRNVRTASWSSADLTGILAGSDPMGRIKSRVNDYWYRQYEFDLVSTLTGVFADNTANAAGDMSVVLGADAAGSPTSANLISAEGILEAAQTMGDSSEGLSLLIMHSRIYTNLAKLNLIDFIPDSEGHVHFPTYLGYRVIKDDSVPVVQGTTNTARFLYSTYLVGAGAIGWAESGAGVETEVWRYPDQGNGMGVETLFTRRQYILNPYGFRWLDASRAGNFPTNAEKQMAANWSRVVPERKQVPLARLVTNG